MILFSDLITLRVPNILVDLACDAKSIKLEAFRLQFVWDVVDVRLKSGSTIHRNLVRMRFSLKVLKRRNINRCNIEGVHFFEEMQGVNIAFR